MFPFIKIKNINIPGIKIIFPGRNITAAIEKIMTKNREYLFFMKKKSSFFAYDLIKTIKARN